MGVDWYAYVYNLQGDVIALTNNSGSVVVAYSYDAWGKPLATTGTLAATLGRLNPFRYRGYVYDEETGLYYLRSRYYRAEWGRFVNADALVEGNLYSYCSNLPVTFSDQNGFHADDPTLIETNELRPEYALIIRAGLVTEEQIRFIDQQLQLCAIRANSAITGSGPIVGTQKHKVFRDNVEALHIPGIRTEVSYRDGEIVDYATPGSKRFDVILFGGENCDTPIIAWDFKTGKAKLTAKRIEELLEESHLDIPIVSIHVR